jgi:hypothetical protein
MTADERNAIRARAEAATPGPWARDLYEDGESGEGPLGVFPGARGEWVESNNVIRPPSAEGDLGDDVATCDRNGDAEFIAHAREDIPRLLADNDALRAEVAALLRALEWRNMLHGERNCPGCSTPEGYAHEPDCALDAMIRKCEGA